ncbi:MAG TPA: AarF/UbiB family protein, partial [Solirubrobacteraceae bacterium]|nr:AarF/UbiB family protein [Solirubrobacteraceae bacterium]
VKVQYPGVADAIRSDLQNLQLMSSFIGLLAGFAPFRVKMDVGTAAREIGAQVLDELDYRLEARNQMRFARRYRGHPFIHVPEVIPELSTARVLTQELCVGRRWAEAVTADQALRDRWAEALWRFVYGSYLRFGLLNADPNPGNFLFGEDGSVSFLDYGSVKRHSSEQVAIRAEVVRACVRGDAGTVWRLCVEEGCWRATDPVSPAEALAYWREPFRYVWDEQPFTLTPEYATSWIECRSSLTGPSANAIRHMTMPVDDLVWPRLELGLASMLAELNATNDWRAIHHEYAEGGEPTGEMGRLDRAHFDSVRQG